MICRYCRGGHNNGGNCSQCGAPWTPLALAARNRLPVQAPASAQTRPAKPMWLPTFMVWFFVSVLCATTAAYPPPAGWPLGLKIALLVPAVAQALTTGVFMVWFALHQPDSDL